jgi:hypothetical protein
VSLTEGVLCDHQGKVVHEIFQKQEKVTSEHVEKYCQRSVKIATERFPDRLQVFVLDNANIHVQLPPTAIIPSEINASDGGKNRVAMDIIGKLGLRAIFQALGEEKLANSKVDDMRHAFKGLGFVQDQYSVLETLFRNSGCILLYNTPYFPELNGPIEHLWRLLKSPLKHGNVFGPKQAQDLFMKRLMSPIGQAHLERWKTLILASCEFFLLSPESKPTERDLLRSYEQTSHSLSEPPRSLQNPRCFAALRHASDEASRCTLLDALWDCVHALNIRTRYGSDFDTLPPRWIPSAEAMAQLKAAAVHAL